MRKCFILYLLGLNLVVARDPSPIDCAMPPGFVMLSCPVCSSSCRWGFDASASPNSCCFFLIFYFGSFCGLFLLP